MLPDDVSMVAQLYAPALFNKTETSVSKISVAILGEYNLGLIGIDAYANQYKLIHEEGEKYRNELAKFLHQISNAD